MSYAAPAQMRYESSTELISIRDALTIFYANGTKEVSRFFKVLKWCLDTCRTIGKYIAVFSTLALVVTIPDDALFAPIPILDVIAWGNDITWLFAAYAMFRLSHIYFGHNVPIKRARKRQQRAERQAQRVGRKMRQV